MYSIPPSAWPHAPDRISVKTSTIIISNLSSSAKKYYKNLIHTTGDLPVTLSVYTADNCHILEL